MTEDTTAAAGRFRWHPHHQFPRSRIPRHLRTWLLDPDSLTRRLQHACNGRFSVRVFGQSWQRPALDEAVTLGFRPDRWALLREVHLFCDHTPLVYARTVIPGTTLTGSERRLAKLGGRPLGAFLFANPGMRRGPVELARITPGSATFQNAVYDLTRRPREIWGRRSVFYLGNKPLLVSEIFLPAIRSLQSPGPVH